MLTIIFAVLIYAGYLIATYIDETITSGEGYGFKIGETKEQVFQRAGQIYQENAAFILYPLDERGYGPHKKMTFGEENESIGNSVRVLKTKLPFLFGGESTSKLNSPAWHFIPADSVTVMTIYVHFTPIFIDFQPFFS